MFFFLLYNHRDILIYCSTRIVVDVFFLVNYTMKLYSFDVIFECLLFLFVCVSVVFTKRNLLIHFCVSLFTWKTFILSVLWCLGVIRRAAFFQVFEEIQNISSSEQNKIVSKLTGSSFVLKNVLQRGNFVCQNQRCWNKFIWNRHTWTLDNSYVYFYLKNYYRE